MSSTTQFNPADAFSFDRTASAMKRGVESATGAQADLSHKATQAGKDLVVFSQGNMEAVTQASQVFAAGVQDLMRQMSEAGQAAMHETLASFRAITSAQSPKAMIELQANFVRSSAVHAVTEGARIAQSGIDLAERVSAPLVARMAVAAETATAHRA